MGDFMNFFGADQCWVSLCEEGSNPSELMLRIVLEEIAHCAGADFGDHQCIYDQVFALLFTSDASDSTFDGVRRKLEHALGGPGQEAPCEGQPSDEELAFISGLLLAGAAEQCMELGENFMKIPKLFM